MALPTIIRISGREILSSGGNPTIEACVELSNGIRATASVPYGVSSGSHEAFILLDGDKKRYRGMGMKKAARNISTTLHTLLRGTQITKLRAIDEMMIANDGTKNKSRQIGRAHV